MKVSGSTAAFQAYFLIHSAMAAVTPPSDGSILACHDQGCNNCSTSGSSVNGGGYPNCVTYNSADTLGDSFTSSSGNGYDVWWDSGTPNPTCQIIVRTPASTELPDCGYFLTSWSDAGCYYTSIQDTFMLQYCCGSGDCGSAQPAASVEDAHAQSLMGKTTIVSLPVGNLAESGDSGKRSIEGIGEISWKRSDYAYSKRAEVAEVKPRQDNNDCTFNPTTDMMTVGAQQVRASDTQVCNTQGGCSLTASVTVTEGETINPSLTGNFFGIIAAAVGVTFMQSTSFLISETYTQQEGTTGYMSFIPTLDCWNGTFSNCAQNINGNIIAIDPTETYQGCTPATLPGGQLDGTFSFVYTT